MLVSTVVANAIYSFNLNRIFIQDSRELSRPVRWSRMDSFTGTIRKSGDVVVVTIPRQYVTDGHLKDGTRYRFHFEEAKENAE